ncbi:ribonuclease HII [Dissulfurispira thermophila]|uniref:Ribonuclease HII n=1 Tax=Dissulfurispira thermophila TaxID=2715679 RepID=A0A7G1H430_9BACT|nr:ribonuclease HII [Dissulfurispira thermophila]BCB96686.1 ribonuclease HII [Dissulfurispira thermophila]
MNKELTSIDPYEYDESIRKNGFGIIAGIDEAGRGPVAGPVVAAAVILPCGVRIEGIRDSKKIPEKEREILFYEILLNALCIGIGIVDANVIDRINILRATRQAMYAALVDLTNNMSIRPDIILIDALTIPSMDVKQMSIIKGDAKSASIAAASIIAKVVRDGIMKSYHSIYPQYGFDKHKGYATKAHLDKINKYGPCPIHRKSFQKVMDLVLPLEQS